MCTESRISRELRDGGESVGRDLGQDGDVDVLGLDPLTGAVEARQPEEVLDEAAHPPALPLDPLEGGAVPRGVTRFGEGERGLSLDHRERCAQLVGGVRRELHLADPGQLDRCGHPAAHGQGSEEDGDEQQRPDDALGEDEVRLRRGDAAQRLCHDHPGQVESNLDGDLGLGVVDGGDDGRRVGEGDPAARYDAPPIDTVWEAVTPWSEVGSVGTDEPLANAWTPGDVAVLVPRGVDQPDELGLRLVVQRLRRPGGAGPGGPGQRARHLRVDVAGQPRGDDHHHHQRDDQVHGGDDGGAHQGHAHGGAPDARWGLPPPLAGPAGRWVGATDPVERTAEPGPGRGAH